MTKFSLLVMTELGTESKPSEHNLFPWAHGRILEVVVVSPLALANTDAGTGRRAPWAHSCTSALPRAQNVGASLRTEKSFDLLHL